MATTPKVLYRATHTTTAAVSTPVPATKTWIVTNVIIVNTGATTSVVTLALDGVTLVSQSLAAGASTSLACTQPLAAGKSLAASIGTASTVAFHVAGVEM